MIHRKLTFACIGYSGLQPHWAPAQVKAFNIATPCGYLFFKKCWWFYCWFRLCCTSKFSRYLPAVVYIRLGNTVCAIMLISSKWHKGLYKFYPVCIKQYHPRDMDCSVKCIQAKPQLMYPASNKAALCDNQVRSPCYYIPAASCNT